MKAERQSGLTAASLAGRADRAVGAAWPSVRGPADGKALAVWLLELGFRGLVLGPAPRPIDEAGLLAAVREVPLRLRAVRVSSSSCPAEQRTENGLASRSESERDVACLAVGRFAAQAATAGIDMIVLEPGVVGRGVVLSGDEKTDTTVDLADSGWTPENAVVRRAQRSAGLDAALDAACRSLHALAKRHPEATFCLTGSSHVAGLGEISALTAIFEDLPRVRLAYWHDAAVAQRRAELLGEDEGACLEAFADRMAGVTLSDADGSGGLRLPPGAGHVDFQLVASYLSRAGLAGRPCVRVVDLDPEVDPAEIAGVHSFLAKYGL